MRTVETAALSSPRRHLFDDRRNVKRGKPRLRFIVTENQDARTPRIDRGVVSGCHHIFATVTGSNSERTERGRVEKLANSRNHYRIVTGKAGWLKIAR